MVLFWTLVCFSVFLNLFVVNKLWKNHKIISILIVLSFLEIFWVFNLFVTLGYEKISSIFVHSSWVQLLNIFTPGILHILTFPIILIFGQYLLMLPGGLFLSWFKEVMSKDREVHDKNINELKKMSEFKIDK